MPVLVIAETEGVTPEMHDGMVEALGARLRDAQGFIAHLAGPLGDKWRVIEIWETKQAATDWFARYVHPNLPEGVKPKRTIHELHTTIVR